jgi:hypothetical protein
LGDRSSNRKPRALAFFFSPSVMQSSEKILAKLEFKFLADKPFHTAVSRRETAWVWFQIEVGLARKSSGCAKI